MTASASPLPVAMLDRVEAILDTLERSGGMTLSQVVSRTGLPRSSAHRILEHLVRVRWLRRDELRYHLGLRIMELGTAAGYQHRLRGAAMPHLHGLAERFGLTVHLAVLDGSEIIYLDKIGSRVSLQVPSRVGGRAPAHCTALGKVLLAHVDDHSLDALLDQPLVTPTASSIGTERGLRRELAAISDRGVAFDREESARGLACVASPIGTAGAPVAALSICGPASSMRLEQMIASVRSSARAVWFSFGAGCSAPPSNLFEGRLRAVPHRSAT